MVRRSLPGVKGEIPYKRIRRGRERCLLPRSRPRVRGGPGRKDAVKAGSVAERVERGVVLEKQSSDDSKFGGRGQNRQKRVAVVQPEVGVSLELPRNIFALGPFL